MKQQELYNKIRTRINELVPRLKDLSFGCEVLVEDTDINKKEKAIFLCIRDRDDKDIYADILIKRFNDFSKRNYYQYFDEVLIDEIIGHPIHLEHILEAIEIKTGIFVKTGKTLTFLDKEYNTLLSYNFSLPLQDQSLETLEALDKLLNTNEK